MLLDAHEIWIEPREVRPIHLKFMLFGNQQATFQFTIAEAETLASDLKQAAQECKS